MLTTALVQAHSRFAFRGWPMLNYTMNFIHITLLVLLSFVPLLRSAEPSRDKVSRFVLQVASGTEYGDTRRVASKWTHAPTVSVFGATPQQKLIVEEVFRSIGPSFRQAIGEVQMLADNTPTASMKIYFGTQKELSRIGKEHDIKYNKDDYGFFWIFWDESHAITSTYVFLATDKLREDNLKHYVFEEVTQSFGLASDSDEFKDSIFYAKGSDGGDASQPSPLDLKLLKWFYEHVEPGDSKKVISEKWDATWPKDS